MFFLRLEKVVVGFLFVRAKLIIKFWFVIRKIVGEGQKSFFSFF